MEVKMIKEIKKWVLFNILKGKAHLLRLKHFLRTGRDIETLPQPQKRLVTENWLHGNPLKSYKNIFSSEEKCWEWIRINYA